VSHLDQAAGRDRLEFALGQLGRVHGGRRLTALCAFLPLRISGGQCTHDLERSSLLIRSLGRFWEGELPFPLVVCVRRDERRAIAEGLARHPRVAVELVDEVSLVPELIDYEPFDGWTKQMLLKLAYGRVARSDYYVTLDADVVCVRPISESVLLPGDRAVTEWEPKADHAEWWRESAALLRCPVDFAAQGLGVTPNLFSSELARGVLDELERLWGESAAALLLRRAAEGLAKRRGGEGRRWSEYSLYGLHGETGGGLSRFHLMPAEQEAADVRLHVEFDLWKADREAFLRWSPAERLAESRRGFFLVCQSNIGQEIAPLAEVEAKLAPLIV
jgi:hypothetical protein